MSYEWPTSDQDEPGTVCVICGEPRSQQQHDPGYQGGHPHPFVPEGELTCVDCRAEFKRSDVAHAEACPRCGSRGVPSDAADDVRVTINWGELMVLVMWAERWAMSGEGDEYAGMLRTVYSIAGMLQEQHAERPALTLSAQVEQVREQFPGTTCNVPRGGPPPPRVS